jgi:hypothetical protein
MRLTKKSKELMSFFIENKKLHPTSQTTNQTRAILKVLYQDIYAAHQYLLQRKREKSKYYTVSIKKITHPREIIKPQTFPLNSIPPEIRRQIGEDMKSELTYEFAFYDRRVKLHFTLEKQPTQIILSTFQKYVDSIILWMYILNKYSSKKCVDILTVYFYFTSHEKRLPVASFHVLDQIHVNTAFTTTCPKVSEIVVFRKEEWFKVFIHETIHNFGLDFSDMDNTIVHQCILQIFQVKSEVNAYESYTEFWAEIMNACFCGFFAISTKTDFDDFLSYTEFFIQMERTYSFFQLAKVLQFMGLKYEDLYAQNKQSRVSRDNLYKERSNVLAYYVMKCILMNHYEKFMSWCKKHNTMEKVLQFNKTTSAQAAFCQFIEQFYKSPSMKQGVNYMMQFLEKNANPDNFIMKNLRMSICEMG